MRHYFIDRPRNPDEYFTFCESFLGVQYTFDSADDMFSKNSIDEGSKTLISTFIDNYGECQGTLLDLCCGYGSIGIVIASKTRLDVTMTDINQTAVELAKSNIKKNKVKVDKIVVGDKLNNVGNFDFIVTNPPIKTGKELLFALIDEAYMHLNEGGNIVLVIRKAHGQESLMRHMSELFGNATVLRRNKGYYILQSKKEIVSK